MNIRLAQENKEEILLSHFATRSNASRGRAVAEEKCPIRTEFQRDRDRIIHSKAFRRLKHKTQVFISPEGDHYRTRLTHTLEVNQIARSIGRALELNEDLVEAIALGHDLGHTPFGHNGEAILNNLSPYGFEHNVQSLRVVERLEKDGRGLNLTWEVRDGIINHRTSGRPSTLEGKVVQLSDKIAYINHDIDDGIRAGILTNEDIPKTIRDIIGNSSSSRINTFITDTIKNSIGGNNVTMSRDMRDVLNSLRDFMFDKVYKDDRAKREFGKIENLLSSLYRHHKEHPEDMSEEFRRLLDEGEDIDRVVCDYIAGMTDRYAVKVYGLYFMPDNWSIY